MCHVGHLKMYAPFAKAGCAAVEKNCVAVCEESPHVQDNSIEIWFLEFLLSLRYNVLLSVVCSYIEPLTRYVVTRGNMLVKCPQTPPNSVERSE